MADRALGRSLVLAVAAAAAMSLAAQTFNGRRGGAIVNGGGSDEAQPAATDDAPAKPAVPAPLSKKKGLNAATYIPHDGYLAVGAAWAHSPIRASIDLPAGVELVPVVYESAALASQLDHVGRLSPKPREIIGLDEPAIKPSTGSVAAPREAYLSAALESRRLADEGRQAAARWSGVAAAARRLGARAGAPDAKLAEGPFLKTFVVGADASGAKPDFVAVRWSGPPDFAAFKRDVRKACREWRRPVWLVEFSVPGAGKARERERVADFLREALPWLEADSCVERYAWFEADPRSAPPAPAALWSARGALTELGRIYADCGRPPTGRPPAQCLRQ